MQNFLTEAFMDDIAIKELSDIIKNSENIVFFGGAGVSTESNIPDFRSEEGIYNIKNKYNYPPETMLSHSFFMNETFIFYDFYKTKMIFPNAKPNLAHTTLAKLEKMGKLKAVITQNIDGLHQVAGSRNVLELHGSIHRNYCMHCKKFFDLDYVLNSKDIPLCDICSNIVKPDVVLYEEGLDHEVIGKSVSAIKNADTLIIGGTSLSVYPAAGLIDYYKGYNLILINKGEVYKENKAKLVFKDSIGTVLDLAVK